MSYEWDPNKAIANIEKHGKATKRERKQYEE
jgi:uncharacterized DUF497 family protein